MLVTLVQLSVSISGLSSRMAGESAHPFDRKQQRRQQHQASDSSIEMHVSRGFQHGQHRFFPVLAAAVADMVEAWALLGLQGVKCDFPSITHLVPKDQLDNVHDTSLARTAASTDKVMALHFPAAATHAHRVALAAARLSAVIHALLPAHQPSAWSS